MRQIMSQFALRASYFAQMDGRCGGRERLTSERAL